MALIKCAECSKEISNKATACPHCGCPLTAMNEVEGVSVSIEDTPLTYNKTSETDNSKSRLEKKAKNIKIIVSIAAVSIILIVFLILIFTHTICLKHSYSEATVLQPQTCYYCGKTKGVPKDLMKIEFPTKGVGSLLPIPKSNMGEINWNEENSFNVYVGNTTEEDFNEYIQACVERGFDVDYQQGDDYFYADDINGNNLNIWFKGKDIMEIQIIAPNPEQTDADFLSEMEKSVLDRMQIIADGNYNKNSVVTSEINNLQPFVNKEFSDSELKNLALKYMEGLNLQKEASEAEFEYEKPIDWQKGIVICHGVLNDLYEKYDFLKDNKEFVNTYISSYDQHQALLKAYESVDKDLSSQVSDNMVGDYDGKNLNFSFKNNTEYTFNMLWKITYFDAKETVVGTESTVVKSIKPNSNYTVSFYVPYPNSTDHYEFSGYYTEIVIKNDISDENFVAQGETMLMEFLDNAANNGYEIVDPKKDGSYVKAKAKKGTLIFNIQYMVENQKVYMVEIKTGAQGKGSSEYKDCIAGLGKALNPDINVDTLKNAIESALLNPSKRVIESQTLFLFDESKGVFTITH